MKKILLSRAFLKCFYFVFLPDIRFTRPDAFRAFSPSDTLTIPLMPPHSFLQQSVPRIKQSTYDEAD